MESEVLEVLGVTVLLLTVPGTVLVAVTGGGRGRAAGGRRAGGRGKPGSRLASRRWAAKGGQWRSGSNTASGLGWPGMRGWEEG